MTTPEDAMQIATRRFPRAFSWIAAAALASSPAAGVLVVSPGGGPGVDAITIGAAVDLAQEGDTILVRSGTYPAFTIDGKSLCVVADAPDVTVGTASFLYGNVPAIVVRNVASSQQVVLRRLRSVFGVEVEDCEGSVWFDEHVVVDGTLHYQCQGLTGAIPGAGVANSSAVTFTRCALLGEGGGSQSFTASTGGPGVAVAQSTVRFFDCTILGGEGAWATNLYGSNGGTGLRIDGATLLVAGCTVEGGPGGLRIGPVCTTTHYQGGAGVTFGPAGGTLRSLESTAVGGALDLGTLCPGETGPSGPAIEGSGTIVPLYGYARQLVATSPVRGGETLALTVQGQSGEIPLLLVSQGCEPLDLLSYSGALLVGLPPEATFVLGALPASGQATLSFATPNVGALIGASTFYAQAVFLDPSPAVWLGAGCTLTLLDASY